MKVWLYCCHRIVPRFGETWRTFHEHFNRQICVWRLQDWNWSIFPLWWTWASLSHCECTYILVLVVPSWGSLTWSWSWESQIMRPHWRDHFFFVWFITLLETNISFFPRVIFWRWFSVPCQGIYSNFDQKLEVFGGSTLRFQSSKNARGGHLQRAFATSSSDSEGRVELVWKGRKVNPGCCECCLTWSFFGMLMLSTSDFKKNR